MKTERAFCLSEDCGEVKANSCSFCKIRLFPREQLQDGRKSGAVVRKYLFYNKNTRHYRQVNSKLKSIADSKHKEEQLVPQPTAPLPSPRPSGPRRFRKPHEVYEFGAIAVRVIAASTLCEGNDVVVGVAINVRRSSHDIAKCRNGD